VEPKPKVYDVIDNFLDKKYFNPLYDYLFDNYTAWYPKTFGTVKDMPIDVLWFSHCLYTDQQPNVKNYRNLIPPILKALKARSVIRVTANLVTRQPEQIKTHFHQDVPYTDSKTAILYINTCNGSTVIKTKKGEDLIKSVENRLLVFPSNTYHGSILQSDTDRRVVVNFNYF